MKHVIEYVSFERRDARKVYRILATGKQALIKQGRQLWDRALGHRDVFQHSDIKSKGHAVLNQVLSIFPGTSSFSLIWTRHSPLEFSALPCECTRRCLTRPLSSRRPTTPRRSPPWSPSTRWSTSRSPTAASGTTASPTTSNGCGAAPTSGPSGFRARSRRWRPRSSRGCARTGRTSRSTSGEEIPPFKNRSETPTA
jgi:hypothetical protein